VSYAPSTILALRSYLIPYTHLSPAALGIVGDAAHARRASYHNGWDRVIAYGRTAATDYTIRTARDRALPRTYAASALDIGNFPKLRSLSLSLVAQARANLPGTRDMREIIYSPDGQRVLRWDRERGYSSMPRTGEADNSHLWHTHVSWYRDSEKRSKLLPFQRYFEPDLAPAFRVAIDGRTPLFTSAGDKVDEVSGLTVTTAKRLPTKIQGRWLYRIVEGKYSGRFLAPTGETTFTPIEA
jgi:hypothetical protein